MSSHEEHSDDAHKAGCSSGSSPPAKKVKTLMQKLQIKLAIENGGKVLCEPRAYPRTIREETRLIPIWPRTKAFSPQRVSLAVL